MTVKFNRCNTDVTKFTVHYNMPTSQIKCYSVTAHPLAKKQKIILTTISYLVEL